MVTEHYRPLVLAGALAVLAHVVAFAVALA
ncbi:hypothetical protein EDF58_104407 [Novosphingobium sp. PhB57]|jgi:hypothetical protein|nr:hypothetical protein EDF58_104407 [Novosphingobium sp. PhB57]TDW64236.1 hypothetical protein EDF57_10435 [Novosphingobium sp. PhB55]